MATYLDRAIKDGHTQLTGEGKSQKITYLAVNHSEKYNDPEEKVRAEFWAELIYRYSYEPDCIGVEIVVPNRTPNDRADLVIFKDNTRKQPYAVIECKKDGITDAEFNQAVEQTCGNGTWAKFRASYVMVVAGSTRRAFDFTGKYDALEREQNIIADIPAEYGKPEEFKYVKNGPLDIKAVSKEELISAIKKCHQTLWQGGKRTPPEAFGELSKIIFVKISDEKNTSAASRINSRSRHTRKARSFRRASRRSMKLNVSASRTCSQIPSRWMILFYEPLFPILKVSI